jgi:multidrug resistance efflux pump
VTSWKFITGTTTAALGAFILLATGMGEFRGRVEDLESPLSAYHSAENPSDPSPNDPKAIVVAAGAIDVDGGTVPLAPLIAGTVVDVPVQEGMEVKSGQPLVRLDSRLADIQVDQAEAALNETHVQLLQAKQDSSNHRFKIEQLRQTVAAAAARVKSAERQVNKFEALRPKDGVSEESFLSAKDQLAELAAGHRATREQLSQVEHTDPNLVVQQAEVAESAARAKLAAAREHLAKHTLNAPSDGRVLRLQVGVGQVIGPTDPQRLIWFCPDKPFVVRCEVEQEFADLIEPGMKATISNESFDGRKWTGRVRRCAEWVAPRRSLYNKVLEVGDVPTVECIVDIDPGQKSLRIGQRVRAAIERIAAPDESKSQAAPSKRS